jgi:hypothetical protein
MTKLADPMSAFAGIFVLSLMVMARLLGMCCQLTFNQFMASLVNPFAEKCPNY